MAGQQQVVSVVIPVYGVEQYLDRCIQSVVEQDYEQLDIVVVDDGSPDGCPELCDEWAARDSRIRVVHKENGGLASARNAGLDIIMSETWSLSWTVMITWNRTTYPSCCIGMNKAKRTW